MNISLLYDRSIKLIDDSYKRLLRIWELPKGSISKKKINNHIYYYYQYRDGKKIVSRILKKNEIDDLRKKINERKRLVKLNKEAKINLDKNIKVIAIFDKGLSSTLLDEAFAYSFDEIPLKDRINISLPFVNIRGENSSVNNQNLNDYFKRWVNGEIRAREISNYIIQKISD